MYQLSRITLVFGLLLCTGLPALAHEATAAGEAARDAVPVTGNYSQRELLKNWALSTCLAQIAKTEDMRKDALATAGAYLEFGTQGPEAYTQTGQLVQQYVARRYQGTASVEFNTMKCIDLYHSAALNQLVSRFSKSR